jgi:hypothetical protein
MCAALYGQAGGDRTFEWRPESGVAMIVHDTLRGQVFCDSRAGDAELELQPDASNSRLSVTSIQRKMRTSNDGRFDFGALDPGEYKLIVRHRCGSDGSFRNDSVVISARRRFGECRSGELRIKLQRDRSLSVTLAKVKTEASSCF